jgi:hypothetical protein
VKLNVSTEIPGQGPSDLGEQALRITGGERQAALSFLRDLGCTHAEARYAYATAIAIRAERQPAVQHPSA